MERSLAIRRPRIRDDVMMERSKTESSKYTETAEDILRLNKRCTTEHRFHKISTETYHRLSSRRSNSASVIDIPYTDAHVPEYTHVTFLPHSTRCSTLFFRPSPNVAVVRGVIWNLCSSFVPELRRERFRSASPSNGLM